MFLYWLEPGAFAWVNVIITVGNGLLPIRCQDCVWTDDVNWVQKNNFHFNGNTDNFNHEYAHDNVVCKMAAILL